MLLLKIKTRNKNLPVTSTLPPNPFNLFDLGSEAINKNDDDVDDLDDINFLIILLCIKHDTHDT